MRARVGVSTTSSAPAGGGLAMNGGRPRRGGRGISGGRAVLGALLLTLAPVTLETNDPLPTD